MFFKPFSKFFKQPRSYFDYASSTPVDKKMISSFPRIPNYFSGANPGSLHQEGVLLRRALQNARAVTAKVLGAHEDEIIFTSGATESDNLAILGCIKYFQKKGVPFSSIALYTSPFEHSAVSETARSISEEISVCSLVSENGVVLPETITISPEKEVVIISVLYVQNEIGTVQPIKQIAKRIRKLRKLFPEKTILFHVDATQAPLFYDLNVLRLGVDMLTLGATKLYCPKGVGLLWKKRSVGIEKILYGGGQEFGLRPGTEPVQLIHMFAYALSYAQNNREGEYFRTKKLQEYFEEKVEKEFPYLKITGKEVERSPHITHLGAPRFDSELLVLELDARGIALSSKSACQNDQEESSVVQNIYGKEVGSVRVSFGRDTKKSDIKRLLKGLRSVFCKYSYGA